MSHGVPSQARHQAEGRSPRDHCSCARSQWAIFDGARKRAGYQSLSDYVTALLAEHHGLDVPDYARLDDPDQEALLRVG